MNTESISRAPRSWTPAGPVASLFAFVAAIIAGLICGFAGPYGLIVVPLATISGAWSAVPGGLAALLIAAGVISLLRWVVRKLSRRTPVSGAWPGLGFTAGAIAGAFCLWYLLVLVTTSQS